MLHPASRFEVVIHSRADGRSAVKSAAYTARATYWDARLGRRFRASRKSGLLSHEIVGWAGDAEGLWNAVEKSETRCNARIIRELRPALPRELPLPEQIKLVRSFCLWLRDRYGVAIQVDLHAPTFFDRKVEQQFRRDDTEAADRRYKAALFDPRKTNQNFHAHLLMTTRRVCPETGGFGEKTRELDDRKTGPEEIIAMRLEWEKRTNAALTRIGSEARIDMRSYRAMAKAGDAPEGLVTQDHIGPRRTARSRKSIREMGSDATMAGIRRRRIQEYNENLWQSWELLRTLEREKARSEVSAQIAAEREAERKRTVDAERARLKASSTEAEAAAILAAASQFEKFRSDGDPKQALFAAFVEPSEVGEPRDEFSEELDLDTYERPKKPHRKPVLEVRVQRVRVRTR